MTSTTRPATTSTGGIQSLTVERIMQIALFALVFAMATRIPLDTDTWWHLRTGEYIINNGVAYEDPFSHTREGVTWVNHSWGAQVVLHGIYSLGGDIGLSLYTAVLATAGMFFAYLTCSGNTYLRAFAVILGSAAAAAFWSPRPQMFSFLFSTIFLWVLFRYKFAGEDRLWWLPPMFLVWGNLHAGYSIGFIFLAGLIGAEIVANLLNPDGEEVIPWRGIGKLILVSLVGAALVAVNPYGLRMLYVPFQTIGLDVLRAYIQEWRSPDFQQLSVLPFTLQLLLTIGLVGASPRRLRWVSFLLLSGTLYLALNYGRNVAVFAVVATPIIAYHADALLTQYGLEMRPRKRVSSIAGWLNAVLLALILLGALGKIVYALTPTRIAEAQAEYLPVAAADHLRQSDPPREMFNSYNFGGYLLWAVPELPIFADGRTDLYGDVFLLEYIDVYTRANNWQAYFERWDIGTVVVENTNILAGELADSPEWTLDYEDEQAVIYIREDTP